MAQHRPSKPAPVEYSTDEEDMIVYDVDEDAIESNPDYPKMALAPITPKLTHSLTLRGVLLAEDGGIVRKETDVDQWRGGEVIGVDIVEDRAEGLLSLVNTGFTNPGNPSDPSLFSALFLAIPISLSFFSTSGAHFRVSTGGHVPEVPE
ncbi:hypothetical protein TNCV_1921861 [Trichonephila clavipes]|nr:hypothetical protein TNCV_1921861 [Trichonephila clavipes]